MKVRFIRSQHEGASFVGKVIWFKLRCILDINEEERNLIIKYKLNNTSIWALPSSHHNILDLEKGVDFKFNSASMANKYEDEILENLSNLKKYYLDAGRYTGEKIKEI